MRSLTYTLILSSLLAASCSKKQEVITPARKKVIIDSLLRPKVEDIHNEAAEDLDRRRAIEVKAKTDSILDAKAGRTVPDTVKQERSNTPFLEPRHKPWEGRINR